MGKEKLVEVCGIIFEDSHKVHLLESNGMPVNIGEEIIANYNSAVDYGRVVKAPYLEMTKKIKNKPTKIIRRLNKRDRENILDLEKRELRAYSICKKKINDRELSMKLVKVHYSFDKSKIVFYYTAENRVDFRELVKDLVHVFKTRIELRQIGARDETLLLGGLGLCGRELCCHSWLEDFDKISIKMAKKQRLSLNTSKISGLCGRLRCCLGYEYDIYNEELKKYPDIDTKLSYKGSECKVIQVNIIKKSVTMRSKDDVYYELTLKEYNSINIKKPNKHKNEK